MAHISICKYVDALPLYRQSKIFKRANIHISRATMATWMVTLGKNLQPLINLLREYLLSGAIIHCDETTFQVLKEPDRDPSSKSYMWVQTTGKIEQPIVIFDYFPSRSSQVPLKLFEGYSGYLQVDGYAGYNAVSREYDVKLVGCWNHARRKFMNVIKAMEKKSKGKAKPGKATKGLNYIKRLYGIEREIKDKTFDEKYLIRQERSKPILDDMKKWIDKSKPSVPPKTLLGKALGYVDNEWIKLYRYIDDGRLNIDNNHAENAIRPYVIGRKNWLFSDSVKGAYAGANIYSIVETAKTNGLNPFDYMRHIVEKLPAAKSVEDIECLLPWAVKLD
ncbi:MAG: IS66 family transposase [Methylococcales bacterium]|nr:IS66 family transposase [Methylococcales bacterium]